MLFQREPSFSEQLRKKGAGKKLVERAEELEALEREVHRLGGLEKFENYRKFFNHWAPVVVEAVTGIGIKDSEP